MAAIRERASARAAHLVIKVLAARKADDEAALADVGVAEEHELVRDDRPADGTAAAGGRARSVGHGDDDASTQPRRL